MSPPPPPPQDDPVLFEADPREAWTPGENEEEAENPSGYVPWRFREGQGTPVSIIRVARRHPWASAERIQEEVPPATWKDRWRQSSAHRYLQNAGDRWLGFWERRRHAREHRPGQRARLEWLGYYQGLYRGHEPQPELYARLLIRNGVPDWPNPYRPSDPGYYDFHPEGLLAADLEAILLGVQQDWAPPKERDAAVDRHREAARVCWALVVSRSDPLDRISQHLHVANLRLATTDAALSPDLSRMGLTSDQVMTGAQKHGWQEANAPSRALSQMIKALSEPT